MVDGLDPEANFRNHFIFPRKKFLARRASYPKVRPQVNRSGKKFCDRSARKIFT
jgi:hypothetical protein